MLKVNIDAEMLLTLMTMLPVWFMLPRSESNVGLRDGYKKSTGEREHLPVQKF